MSFGNLALLTDTEGKIHVLNLSKNVFEVSHPIQDNTIKFKKVSTCSKYAWAIGTSTDDSNEDSIWIYVPSPDVPIRQECVTYENQRKYLIVGFSSKLLPTDRPAWSDIDGMNELKKESFTLPNNNWTWQSDWFVEDNLEGCPLGPEGWIYALDFPMDYGPDGGTLKWVRRRRWIRRKRFVSLNKWIKINSVESGDTVQEPFIDVSIGTSSVESNPKNYIVWAITSSNKVMYRNGLNYNNCPEGSSWTPIVDTFVKIKSISVGPNNVIWCINTNGELFVRSGITKDCPGGHSWAPVVFGSSVPSIDNLRSLSLNSSENDGSKVRNVSVGLQSVWIVTEDDSVYVRSGIGSKVSSNASRKVSNSSFYNSYETFLTGTNWVNMDIKMDSVYVTHYRDQTFALGVGGRSLYFRGGVDANEPKGKFWKLIHEFNEIIPKESEDLILIKWTSASVSGIRCEYQHLLFEELKRNSFKNSLKSLNSPKISRNSLRNSFEVNDVNWKGSIISKLKERKSIEMSSQYIDTYQEAITFEESNRTSLIKTGFVKYFNKKFSQLVDASIEIFKSDVSSTGSIKLSVLVDKTRLINEMLINFIDVTCIYKQITSTNSFILIKTFKIAEEVKICFINDNEFNEFFKLINELINECFIENQMIPKIPSFYSLTQDGDAYQGYQITEQDYYLKYIGCGHFQSISSCVSVNSNKKSSRSSSFDSFDSNGREQLLAYAITSDGHLYHYTNDDTDTYPIVDTFTYFIYENQRWNPLTGYSNIARLPTDRCNWTDETGTIEMSKESIQLPSKSWKWIDDTSPVQSPSASKSSFKSKEDSQDGWILDINETPGGTNAQGWQFALDFPFSYHPEPRYTDTVRRRRWYKKCCYESTGPWKLIDGPVLIKSVSICRNFWDENEEQDQEQSPNVSKSSNELEQENNYALWAISSDGTPLVRTNVSKDNPSGDNWISINCSKKLLKVSTCCSKELKLSVWTVAEDGSLFLRSEIYKDNPLGVDWFQVEPPKIKCPLVSVSVGPSLVTAIDFKGRLWKRVNVVPSLPMGTGWFKVSKSIKSLSISSNEFIKKSIIVKNNDLNSFIYEDEDNSWKSLKIPNIFTTFSFHPVKE